MKRYFSLLCILFLAAGTRAEGIVASSRTGWGDDAPGFSQGRVYISMGYGLINGSFIAANAIKRSVAKNWDNLSLSKRPIWMAKAEYALTPHWGLGAHFAIGGIGVNATLDSFISPGVRISGELSYSTWSLLTRVNYHIFTESNFDLYVGAGIGFRANNLRVSSNDNLTDRWNFPVDLGFVEKRIPKTLSVPTIGADFTMGMRYHILPPLAVYAEIGVAKSIFQAGATFRF